MTLALVRIGRWTRRSVLKTMFYSSIASYCKPSLTHILTTHTPIHTHTHTQTLSQQLERDRFMTSSSATFAPSPLSFNNRRGNIKFSSARYYPGSKSLRGSKRGRSGLTSSLRGSKRTQRSAARPARCKVVFEKLLQGLT